MNIKWRNYYPER